MFNLQIFKELWKLLNFMQLIVIPGLLFLKLWKTVLHNLLLFTQALEVTWLGAGFEEMKGIFPTVLDNSVI